MKQLFSALLALSLLFGLTGAALAGAPSDGEAALTDPALLGGMPVEDDCGVFYEIFVGSFSDSDGDGVGDLRGIIERMDYLNDGDLSSGRSLGVDGIWLTPIFRSPSYHKYDVANYYKIDPAFGTMDDLRELTELCHERHVKLILDLPINHTSIQNDWFRQFAADHISGKTEDPYYDFYCYAAAGETAPAGLTYVRIPGGEDSYECNFSPDMPELNLENEDVRQAVLDVARFYLELGVDGFRFDAAKYICFGDDERSTAFWSWYMAELRTIKPDIYTVGEVWDAEAVIERYVPYTNCFCFPLSQAEGLIAATAHRGNVNAYTANVEALLEHIHDLRPGGTLVPFIANHDTDRAAGYLTVTNGNMQMAANLYLLGPGSPFIYYGEELGMRGSRGGSSTDANRRLAMPWGDGDTVRDPVGADYDAGHRLKTTAAGEMEDPYSLYNYYKKLLAIRHANPEIARGEYTALAFKEKLGGFVSVWQGRAVCVLHNTTPRSMTVDLGGETERAFTRIVATAGFGTAAIEGSTVTLEGQTSVVLRESD